MEKEILIVENYGESFDRGPKSFSAIVVGEDGKVKRADGSSQVEAIGKLVVESPEVFNLKIRKEQ